MTKTYLLVGEALPRGELRRLEVELALRASGLHPTLGNVGLRGNLLEFVRRTTHVNLLEDYPGPAGKGSAFPIVETRLSARRLVDVLAAGPRFTDSGTCTAKWAFGGRLFALPSLVILCGARVGQAFGLGDAEYFRRHRPRDMGCPAVVVPHPSGVNRWWNDAANEDSARRFLARLGRP